MSAGQLAEKGLWTLRLVAVLPEGTLTYSEFAYAIGHSSSRVSQVLADVDKLCIDRGWPHLTTLVVHKSGRYAGQPDPLGMYYIGVTDALGEQYRCREWGREQVQRHFSKEQAVAP
jgi:hypothetical protein